MKIAGPSIRRRPRIEIIPLIDVVFFLLATFVMVSLSMVRNQGIPLRLPRAASGLPQERARAVTISLTESGELYLNKTLIHREELEGQLRHLKESEPELNIFINGDVGASFGSAIEVLDLVRMLGIATVSIQTTKQSVR
jgi:biopolymer transport protein ExbD